MLRLFILSTALTLLVGCAKPPDPRGDISRAVVILLYTTEPDSTASRVSAVLKNSVPDKVRIAKGDLVTWPLLDEAFTRSNPLRLVFFENSEPKFLAQFAGPRWEAPVTDGRLGLYKISIEEFRSLIAQSHQTPNKSPEPTTTSVMPAAKQPSRRP